MACIKYLIMDVDGTLTDGKIYMSDSGELCKAFNVKDGCGIKDLLIPHGILPIILTGRKSKIVERRSRELGITEIYQGTNNKRNKLVEIAEQNKMDFAACAYIGDDINDLPCMGHIKNNGGIVGCPADAANQVIEIADFVSTKAGGEGAVREFIEWLLSSFQEPVSIDIPGNPCIM